MSTDPDLGVQAAGPEDTTTKRPERVIAKPGADSRLESLHSLYNSYKAEAQAAQQKFDDLKKAIVAELEASYTEDERPSKAYEIPSSLYGPAITVFYKSQEYLPSESIKANFPDIYETFKKTKVFSEVRESQAGKGRGGRRK